MSALKKVFPVLVLLALVTLACGITGSPPDEAEVEPTSVLQDPPSSTPTQAPASTETTSPSATPAIVEEPTEPPLPTQNVDPSVEAVDGTIFWQQWASGAYTVNGEKVAGEPDTLVCGHAETAWYSLEPGGVEVLPVTFGQIVMPREVNIYQSFNPSQITKVELVDYSGEFYEIYTAEPQLVDECPLVLHIEVPDEFHEIAIEEIYITIDQSILADGVMSEIDAVELVGYMSISDPVLNPNEVLGVSPYELSPGAFYMEVTNEDTGELAVLQGGGPEVGVFSSFSRVSITGYKNSLESDDDTPYTLTLMLPHELEVGFYELLPNMFVEDAVIPSVFLQIGDQFYYGIGGSLTITDVYNGNILGWFSFNAVLDDPELDETLVVTGAFNELPLE